MKLRVFNTADETLRAVSEQLRAGMQQCPGSPFHLALSGAGTAQQLFRLWTHEYREKINWDQLRFYWVDERCVSPEDEESNYRHAEDLLFRPMGIPAEHIHRIFGENDPETEAERYSRLVCRELPGNVPIPRFDAIILGIGEDGHTASIFPGNPELLQDQRCYAVAVHPQSGQRRITMTGPLILQGKMILIPVLGEDKTRILQKVIHSPGNADLPAGYIVRQAIDALIYTDAKVDDE